MKSLILILNFIILSIHLFTGQIFAQTDNTHAVISGLITDEEGKYIPNATVRLERNGETIAQTQTDASGSYRLSLLSARGTYDLSATSGDQWTWQLGLRLSDGERRQLNLRLKTAISIAGTLLMLDDATPHVAVPVQDLEFNLPKSS